MQRQGQRALWQPSQPVVAGVSNSDDSVILRDACQTHYTAHYTVSESVSVLEIYDCTFIQIPCIFAQCVARPKQLPTLYSELPKGSRVISLPSRRPMPVISSAARRIMSNQAIGCARCEASIEWRAFLNRLKSNWSSMLSGHATVLANRKAFILTKPLEASRIIRCEPSQTPHDRSDHISAEGKNPKDTGAA